MRNVLFAMLLLLLASCARQQTSIVDIPEPLEDSKTPEQSHRTPGSLWTSESTSMFSDQKARNVGDIVTIIISESSSASKQATTSTGRDTEISAGIPNLFGLENSSFITDSNLDLNNIVTGNFSDTFDGTGTTTRKGNLTASLTTQVIERYPNGNLKIRGGKEVMVNNEVQIIYLTGIIRTVDITAANTIPSSKVLNARITYTGQGAIADKQKPGWLMRTLDNVWPF
ncbi:flagellar basal body L-ring protein FlgH [Desulfopila aestuarii]|uniref:Flagellar L-ring protein n=1 Tax=Desulfopila aestuarii DSM 18488 TaxID=1121416 RepID=A0A1M7YDT2_9BACT|nr:flagellar basal body L-ring protein FlgH [Desulfopila aestuarii]SHO50753.1 flagellar L-ring protein precursor FlgH [Desulfopila aestuarii DSM 18488]